MSIEWYVRKLWYTVIYSVSTIVYLIFLHGLNKELLLQQFNTDLELLQYKEWLPMKYFAIALILFICGILLVAHKIKEWRRGLEDDIEIMVWIITIFVVGVLLFLIIVLINNPILRAIFSCVFATACFLALESD